jgi:hypothetical protein
VTKNGVNVFCGVSSCKVYGPFFFAEQLLPVTVTWIMPETVGSAKKNGPYTSQEETAQNTFTPFVVTTTP